jgi:hypothetical protein
MSVQYNLGCCDTCAGKKAQNKQGWEKTPPCKGCGWDSKAKKNRNWIPKEAKKN